MSMIWLVESMHSSSSEQGTKDLIAELKRRELRVETPRDFGSYLFGDQALPRRSELPFPDDALVMGVGTLGMSRMIKVGFPKLRPGVWDNMGAIDFDLVADQIGPYLLNGVYLKLPWATVCCEPAMLFKALGPRLFIKPNANDKLFDGCTVDEPGFNDFLIYATSNGRKLYGDTEIIVAPAVKRIEAEWRYYVRAEGGVITGSQYRRDGRLAIAPTSEAGAWDLADTISRQGLVVDPVYVVDVCRVDGDYRVVELGTFSPCGIYAPDLPKLVDAVTEICDKHYG